MEIPVGAQAWQINKWVMCATLCGNCGMGWVISFGQIPGEHLKELSNYAEHWYIYFPLSDIDITYLTASIDNGISTTMIDRRTATITTVRWTNNYIIARRGKAAIFLTINVYRIPIGIGTYSK